MNRRPTIALLLFALILSAAGGARAGERNLWPFWVGQTDAAGNWQEWQAAGPLIFKQRAPDGSVSGGLRPIYLWDEADAGQVRTAAVLYPIYHQKETAELRSWTVFNLINRAGPGWAPAGGREPEAFDVWPFYFSRATGSPAASYQGFFPVAGTIKRRFGYDRLTWAIFPLYWRSERAGVVTTSTPWPFIQHSAGNGHHGFALWPLHGRDEKPGAYRHRYYLWPLLYKNETRLSEPASAVQEGFLPFYAREKNAELVSEIFLWPFFGYTNRVAPKRYHEVRYFWPLLVQGRGDERHVNRWSPFYTHSIIKGVDKTWVGWPLIRHQDWSDESVRRTRTQFLFFLYWSEQQRSLANPSLPPAAKIHLWPLLSVWNNGAGRRQAQFPSPLEVFFPANDKIRQLYSPLFALYRFDQRAAGDVRTSLLWNAITWRRNQQQREFHLGPLFSTESSATGRRIALGNGVIGFRREGKRGRWWMFLFDFSPHSEHSAALQPR
jgi:hypothetical protein